MKFARCALGALLAAVAGIASAAPLDIKLLGSPEVRKELGLSQETQTQIVGLLTTIHGRLAQGGIMSGEEYRERQRLSIEIPRTILALLNEPQRRRLREIQTQRIAPYVLNDPDLARQIGATIMLPLMVSGAQEVSNREYEPRLSALYRTLGALPHDGEAEPKRRELTAKIEAVEAERFAANLLVLRKHLMTGQRSRFEALLGKPFPTKLTDDVPRPQFYIND